MHSKQNVPDDKTKIYFEISFNLIFFFFCSKILKLLYHYSISFQFNNCHTLFVLHHIKRSRLYTAHKV
jgi:hypothetical protein